MSLKLLLKKSILLPILVFIYNFFLQHRNCIAAELWIITALDLGSNVQEAYIKKQKTKIYKQNKHRHVYFCDLKKINFLTRG